MTYDDISPRHAKRRGAGNQHGADEEPGGDRTHNSGPHKIPPMNYEQYSQGNEMPADYLPRLTQD
jgi:hypothetical protein